MENNLKGRKPWETSETLCTEAKYIAWIRGALRKSWTRYPTQNQYKNSLRTKVPVLDENGNQKIYKTGKRRGEGVFRWECPCEGCGSILPASKIQVDHMQSAGNTSTLSELQTFMLNLFCGTDNLQLLCKECHEIKTHMDRYGFTTKEEAIKDKARILFFKKPLTEQKQELKKLGATEEDLRNDKTRQAFYRKCCM